MIRTDKWCIASSCEHWFPQPWKKKWKVIMITMCEKPVMNALLSESQQTFWRHQIRRNALVLLEMPEMCVFFSVNWTRKTVLRYASSTLITASRGDNSFMMFVAHQHHWISGKVCNTIDDIRAPSQYYSLDVSIDHPWNLRPSSDKWIIFSERRRGTYRWFYIPW